jgi:hypothetical protein
MILKINRIKPVKFEFIDDPEKICSRCKAEMEMCGCNRFHPSNKECHIQPLPNLDKYDIIRRTEAMFELDKQALDDHIMGVYDPNAPFNQEEDNFVSDCCGANEIGELDDYDKDKPLGMCSKCKEQITFHLESEDCNMG